jgi:hypothetical protein
MDPKNPEINQQFNPQSSLANSSSVNPVAFDSKKHQKVLWIVFFVLVLAGIIILLWVFGNKTQGPKKPGTAPAPAAHVSTTTIPQISLSGLHINRDDAVKNLPVGFPLDSSAQIFFSYLTPSATNTVSSVQFITTSSVTLNHTIYLSFLQKDGWNITQDVDQSPVYKKLDATKNKENLEITFTIPPMVFKNDLSSSTPPGVMMTKDSAVLVNFVKPH